MSTSDTNNLSLIADQENRLDIYLSEKIEGFSRSYFKDLIKDKKVLLNGAYSKPSKKVLPGDKIEVELIPEKTIEAKPEYIPLNILYEDDDIIVVNKEQGMVVHPAPGALNGTLVNALLFHTDKLSDNNGNLRPGIVHRIDKDTSGILVVAKNRNAHIELSKQLEDHSMNREYIALVNGIVKNDKGSIALPIGRDPNNRIRMAVNLSNGKEAITHYEVIKRFKEGFTLVRFKLETGRTHQIRVHMKQQNHPISGDPVYGGDKHLPFKTKGQLLHARKLGFIHPTTHEYIEFESELPNYFSKIISNLHELD